MMSTAMMQGLVVFYACVAIVSWLEGNYPRALYWAGAGIITSAVLWGTP